MDSSGHLRQDPSAKKDAVCPAPGTSREGVRWLEFYESQMLAKTYLNIEAKNGRKRR
ncbi:MAG TPA: hypothetical protein VMF63_01660 [Opitutaceae bacterium]|nr:hypothetical protein [Opitutaceae bacterium]